MESGCCKSTYFFQKNGLKCETTVYCSQECLDLSLRHITWNRKVFDYSKERIKSMGLDIKSFKVVREPMSPSDHAENRTSVPGKNNNRLFNSHIVHTCSNVELLLCGVKLLK